MIRLVNLSYQCHPETSVNIANLLVFNCGGIIIIIIIIITIIIILLTEFLQEGGTVHTFNFVLTIFKKDIMA